MFAVFVWNFIQNSWSNINTNDLDFMAKIFQFFVLKLIKWLITATSSFVFWMLIIIANFVTMRTTMKFPILSRKFQKDSSQKVLLCEFICSIFQIVISFSSHYHLETCLLCILHFQIIGLCFFGNWKYDFLLRYLIVLFSRDLALRLYIQEFQHFHLLICDFAFVWM